MRQLIPLALSVNTLALMWLVGNKRLLGWVLGLGGQAVWFLFIVVFEAWGLLPLAVGLTVVYARNLLLWWRPAFGQRAAQRVRRWLGVTSGASGRSGVEEPVGWTWEEPSRGCRSPSVFDTRGLAWLAIPDEHVERAQVVPVYAGDRDETEAEE